MQAQAISRAALADASCRTAQITLICGRQETNAKGQVRQTVQASAVGPDDPDVVLADRAGSHECDQAIVRLCARRAIGRAGQC